MSAILSILFAYLTVMIASPLCFSCSADQHEDIIQHVDLPNTMTLWRLVNTITLCLPANSCYTRTLCSIANTTTLCRLANTITLCLPANSWYTRTLCSIANTITLCMPANYCYTRTLYISDFYC